MAAGSRREFGSLLIATGADPVRLPIPGHDTAKVRYLRSFAESRAIVDLASNAKHGGGGGASFIGLAPSTAVAGKAGESQSTVASPSTNSSKPTCLESSRPATSRAGLIRSQASGFVLNTGQGQVAARNMLGRREPFDAVPFFWSQHYRDDEVHRSRRTLGQCED